MKPLSAAKAAAKIQKIVWLNKTEKSSSLKVYSSW